MTKLIAVTGATGFIGYRLCRFFREQGLEVKALVRSPEKATGLRQIGAQVIAGNLADTKALQQLVTDSAAIIHCAGAVRGRNLDDFYETNVAAIGRLILAAEQYNPDTKFLFLSSLAARQPDLSDYANSKYLGEREAIESNTNVRFSILRPPAVYGPGDRELLPLFRLMAKGLAFYPGRPSDRVSLLYVDDLLAAIDAWLSLENVPREVFTLSDPVAGGYSWEDIVSIAATVFGRRVRMISAPASLLNGIAAVNLKISRLMGYQPMLTPGKLRELRNPDWCCDHRAFGEISGWQPKVQFSQGLELALKGARTPERPV